MTIWLCGVLPVAADGGSRARALINHQHIYGNLGGTWWEWAFGTGFQQFGEGEVDCSLGQSGQVWFLAGTFGGSANRSCTIARGKSLFFPLVNQLIFYDAGVDPVEFDLTLDEKRIWLDGRVGGGSLDDPQAVADLAELIGAESRVACDLHATLDGKPVVFTTPIVRGQSGPVTITTDDEALADGFYALIAPLEAGVHELQFGGAFCNAGNLGMREFETTASYTLYVEGGVDDDDDND